MENVERIREAITERVRRYRQMHPNESFDAAVGRVAGQLARTVDVEFCDGTAGKCVVHYSGARSEPVAKENYSTANNSKKEVSMSEEKILSAESVVDCRTQELMAKGAIKNYADAMRTVLAADELLSLCYLKGLPYLESSAKNYRSYQDEMVNVGRKARLGALIVGARSASNAPDIGLMLRIANLVPNLVRDAASERLDELANEASTRSGMPQQRSEAYPIALARVRGEHPELVAANESGFLDEAALREIYYPWFSRG